MLRPRCTSFIAAMVLLVAPSAHAQGAADPSGHWNGTLEAPGMEVALEVDLARNSAGNLEGTISVPSQALKGLPLQKVTTEGTAITFYARTDQPFAMKLSADGTSMTGDMTYGGNPIATSLTRTGDARIEAPAKSAAVSTTLAGTWHGTLGVERPLRLVLTISNDRDGTATGRIVNLDEGGLTIPVVIKQESTAVTLASTVVVSSFSGVLSADASELAGTFTQGSLVVPLTFRRAAESSK
jgi:hypothetical protein